MQKSDYNERPALRPPASERLQFHNLVLEDQAALREILGDIQVMYAWEHAFTEEQITAWIENQRRRYEQDGVGYWAARERTSGDLVGLIGLLKLDLDGTEHLAVGYILKRSRWGQGFALEGARACVHYAFDTLGARRILADIRPENHASRRVAERLGMYQKGVHVKHYNGQEMPHLLYWIDCSAARDSTTSRI